MSDYGEWLVEGALFIAVIEQIVIKLCMLLHEQMFLLLLRLGCARMDDCTEMIVFQ